MKRHRVAILGAGIGAQHLDGYLRLPDLFEVAWICDLDASRAETLAERAALCRVATDTRLPLDDPSLDIVDICLPPHLHGPTALAALAAGKHVVCEKPLAGSILEADSMADAAQTASRTLMPIFQYRYGAGFARLAALRRAGLTGNSLVGTLETHWDRTAAYYQVPWRGTWAGERGGAVLGHAIHIHDLAARIFGPVAAVSAHLDTRVNAIETEDCAAIAMTMEDGALVTSSITLGAAGNSSRLRLIFDRLTVESGREPYAPGKGDWSFLARDPADQATVDAVLSAVPDSPDGYAGQFAALASHLAGESADIVTAGDGIRSLEVAAAIYLSAREGRRVTLPLDRRHPICSDWAPAP
jgi:predicted dehydrogenase